MPFDVYSERSKNFFSCIFYQLRGPISLYTRGEKVKIMGNPFSKQSFVYD